MKYATPQAFERTLSDRLKHQTTEEGVELDRLRNRVAFERFLARLSGQAPSRWVLKGGYALELRLGGKARATKDLDLDLPPPPAEDLLDELQEAAEKDLGDFFVFRVSVPKPGVSGLRDLGSPNVMLLPCLITRSREVQGLTLAAGGRSSRRYRL